MRSLVLLAVSCLAIASVLSGQEAPVFRPYERPVVTWVPPYGLARSQARLAGPEVAGALTHVALQFWTPTTEGGVKLAARFDPLTDEAINGWREWAHTHGARVLLCVYNGEEKWDWGLARSAFAVHRGEFVQALLAEMDRRQMDGIDLDLEGDGSFDVDKPAFLAFVSELAEGVRARGKQLFVDSFPHIWNAPNQSWWGELFPLVDGISSMGYESTGSESGGWRGYGAQVAAAGPQAGKLLIGMPTHLERWQEKPAQAHLGWLREKKVPGVALWDAQFKARIWRDAGSWQALRELQGK